MELSKRERKVILRALIQQVDGLIREGKELTMEEQVRLCQEFLESPRNIRFIWDARKEALEKRGSRRWLKEEEEALRTCAGLGLETREITRVLNRLAVNKERGVTRRKEEVEKALKELHDGS